jgi:sigma-E factor negative regulatory protein RseB
LLLSAPVWAADAAHEWLMKMARASRTLDYEGAFVYRHDSQIETLRIIHKVVDGVAQERLTSLSGVRREIVRDAREVRCYYPDDNSVVVEQRRADNRKFPSILPEQLQGLDENYVIQLGKQERVAGRVTQQVLIRARDSYRYGYHLWADRDSGLLLRADLVDEKGRLLEQFVFTHVIIGGNIPLSALAPETERPGMVWHRDSSEPAQGTEASWAATQLPKGFKLSMQIKRELPLRKKPVEHLVYSDGLAAVSVFIEKQESDAKDMVRGSSRRGAVNVNGTQINGHHVTAVGEVPAATVSLIGGSVARRP